MLIKTKVACDAAEYSETAANDLTVKLINETLIEINKQISNDVKNYVMHNFEAAHDLENNEFSLNSVMEFDDIHKDSRMYSYAVHVIASHNSNIFDYPTHGMVDPEILEDGGKENAKLRKDD